MIAWESLSLGDAQRFLPIKDAEPTGVLLPEGFERTDGIHTAQGQQPLHPVCLHLPDRIGVVFTPMQRRITRGIPSFQTNDGELQPCGCLGDGLMQGTGERMRRVNQQPNPIVCAKLAHRRYVHRPRETSAVRTDNLLQRSLCGIEIGLVRLVSDPHGCPPLRSSA